MEGRKKYAPGAESDCLEGALNGKIDNAAGVREPRGKRLSGRAEMRMEMIRDGEGKAALRG
jgi:hypothetical protein